MSDTPERKDTLERFSPSAENGGWFAYAIMETVPQGDWVRYEDYTARVAELEAPRDAAQADAEEWARKCAEADHRAERAEAALATARDAGLERHMRGG